MDSPSPTQEEIQNQWVQVFSQLSRNCGAARGPDAELDLRIAVVLGDDLDAPIRPYTASLEEAVRTLPAGSQAQVRIYADHDMGEAVVYGQTGGSMTRIGMTTALALCSASMQCRASQTQAAAREVRHD